MTKLFTRKSGGGGGGDGDRSFPALKYKSSSPFRLTAPRNIDIIFIYIFKLVACYSDELHMEKELYRRRVVLVRISLVSINN